MDLSKVVLQIGMSQKSDKPLARNSQGVGNFVKMPTAFAYQAASAGLSD